MSDYNTCIHTQYCEKCAEIIGPNYEVSDHLNGKCIVCKIRHAQGGKFHLVNVPDIIINIPSKVELTVFKFEGYTLKGSFDFSEIPEKLHTLFYNTLLVKLGYKFEVQNKTIIPEKPKSFWNKIKNKLKNLYGS